MKERPILFSAPMVRAILEGRKTMTRRVVRPQPYAEMRDARKCPENVAFALPGEYLVDGDHTIVCPYGGPGDRLWVRETFAHDDNFHGAPSTWYRADSDNWGDGPMYWRPSIFMPRALSRILLEVTAVHVERVQEISEADAKAEGIESCMCPDGLNFYPGKLQGIAVSRLKECRSRWNAARFSALWDSINAKRGYGWDANPWVWVIEFRKI